MKKIILGIVVGLLMILEGSCQTTVYPNTRIMTGSFQIAPGAEFLLKGSAIVSKTTGDTIAMIEYIRSNFLNKQDITSGLLNWNNKSFYPYSTQQAGKFDNSLTAPIHVNRLNYDGTFWAYSLQGYNGDNTDAIKGTSNGSGTAIRGIAGTGQAIYGENSSNNVGASGAAGYFKNNYSGLAGYFNTVGGSKITSFNYNSDEVGFIDHLGRYITPTDTFATQAYSRAHGSGGEGGFANPMLNVGDMIYGGSAGTPLARSIGTSGQILAVSGGVPAWIDPTPILTPTNNFLKWNSTSSSYTLYPDSTGTGIVNGMYLGNQDPLKLIRINLNGVLHTSGLWVNAIGGSSFNALNTNGVGIYGNVSSGTAIQGSASSSGTGGNFSSSSGTGILSASTTGVSGIFNNIIGNTSDIVQFQYNGLNKSYIDKDGIYGLSGIYKLPSSAGTSGQFLISSGIGNQLTWTSVNTNTSSLLYWNSILGTYTPYSSISDTSLIFARGTNYSTLNSIGGLVLNGQLYAGSSNISNDRTAIAGRSYSGNAILGTTNSGYGVNGSASDGTGVRANSISGTGLLALSGLGVSGIFKNSTGNVSQIIQCDSSNVIKFAIDMHGNALQSKRANGAITDTFATKRDVRSSPSIGFINPMITSGDIIYGGTSGVATRKAIGSTGQVLTVSGGLPIWANAWSPTNNLIYWNSILGAYTPYTSIMDTSLIFSRGSVPSTQNSTGYLNLNGQLVAGSSHTSNNRNALSGISYSGIGAYGQSSSGIGVKGTSTTGISGVFNNLSGNTSDIAQFQVNSVNKFRIDKDGNAYKAATDTFATKSDIRSFVGDTASLGTYAVLKTDSTKGDGYVTPKMLATAIALPSEDKFLRGAKAAGSDAVAFPLLATPTGLMGGSTYTLLDGTSFWEMFYIPEKITVTGVKFVMQTAGAYTADNYNGVALYSVSGTSYSKVDSTTNDGAIWQSTGSTLKTVAFVNSITLNPGVYMLSFVYNSSAQTTAPVIYASNAASGNAQFIMNNGNKFSGTIASRNTLPQVTNGAALSTSGTVPFLWLYQ